MKKGKVIIIFVLGLLLIAGGIVAIMLIPTKSNKELYVEAVKKSIGLNSGTQNDEIKKISNKIEEYFTDKNYKVTIKGSSSQEEASYTKEDIELYFGNKELFAKINQIISDEEKNVEAYFKDDVLYFTVKDILSKYYYIDSTINNNENNIDINLVKKVINYLIDSFTESLTDDKVTSEKDDLSINGKTYSTMKYSYSFDGDSLYNMLVKFSEKIKSDKELIDLLKEYFEGVFVSQTSELLEGANEEKKIPLNVDELFDYLLEEAKVVKEIGKLFTYTVYEYKDDVICTQVGVDIIAEQGTVPLKISIYNVTENEKMYKKIAITTVGIEMYGFEIVEKANNEYSVILTTMGQNIITGNIKTINDGIELHFESAPILPNKFNLDAKIVKNGSGYLRVNSDSLIADYTIDFEEVDKVPSIDIENSSPIEEMTEEEKEKLKEAFNIKDEDDTYDIDYSFYDEDNEGI